MELTSAYKWYWYLTHSIFAYGRTEREVNSSATYYLPAIKDPIIVIAAFLDAVGWGIFK